jgi:predicted nucleic acid-binding protein
MTLYYLDSSAWVKRHFAEVGTEWVNHLFEAEHTLSCCTLGFVEVNATAVRKCAAGAIDSARLAEVKASLEEDWNQFLWVELTPEMVGKALQVANVHALRGSDCVHLASALALKDHLGIDAQEFAFITSDRELKAAAAQAGLFVIDPQQRT